MAKAAAGARRRRGGAGRLALTRSGGDVASGVRWYGSILMSMVTAASAFRCVLGPPGLMPGCRVCAAAGELGLGCGCGEPARCSLCPCPLSIYPRCASYRSPTPSLGPHLSSASA
jgi:hypothetical protein